MGNDQVLHCAPGFKRVKHITLSSDESNLSKIDKDLVIGTSFSHSNMYGLKSSGGMASMPYHMGGLGLGSLGMGSLDAMHPATMSYGAPCKSQ